MSEKSDFNDELLKDKLEALLDEDNEIKKWNEGIFIKSLILLPIIIFIVGSFFFNKPENLIDVLLVIFYPLALILVGLLIMFVMRSKLN